MSYKDGVTTIAATDAYIVGVVVSPGHTPEEVQALPKDLESYYIDAEDLRRVLKEIPRSKSAVYISIEGQKCELVTDSDTYKVRLKLGVRDPNKASKYAGIKADRLAHSQPNTYSIDSKRLASAVKIAHALNTSCEPLGFKVIKRMGSAAFVWASARPDRGYSKVITSAKYVSEVD